MIFQGDCQGREEYYPHLILDKISYILKCSYFPLTILRKEYTKEGIPRTSSTLSHLKSPAIITTPPKAGFFV